MDIGLRVVAFLVVLVGLLLGTVLAQLGVPLILAIVIGLVPVGILAGLAWLSVGIRF